MNSRALAAELFGTFMLMSAVLASGLFGTTAPARAIGIALSIGLTVTGLAYAIGHVSGAHFNPAVTLGLVSGGRFDSGRALGYIIAQCVGAILSATLFALIIGTGKSPGFTSVANGYGPLSPAGAGLFSVFVVELMLTALFLIVIMGATSRKAPAGFAPLAIGLTLTAIYLMAIPISNASVNPARSLAAALYSGSAALGQVWVFWVAPILGGVVGGVLGRYFQDE